MSLNNQGSIIIPFNYINKNNSNNINNNNNNNNNNNTNNNINNTNINNNNNKCNDCKLNNYSCCETCYSNSMDSYYNDYLNYYQDDDEEEQNQELFKMFGNFNNQKEIYSCPYLNCLNEGYNEEELASHLLESHQEQLLKSIYIVCPLCSNNNDRHGNFIDHIKNYHTNKQN